MRPSNTLRKLADLVVVADDATTGVVLNSREDCERFFDDHLRETFEKELYIQIGEGIRATPATMMEWFDVDLMLNHIVANKESFSELAGDKYGKDGERRFRELVFNLVKFKEQYMSYQFFLTDQQKTLFQDMLRGNQNYVTQAIIPEEEFMQSDYRNSVPVAKIMGSLGVAGNRNAEISLRAMLRNSMNTILVLMREHEPRKLWQDFCLYEPEFQSNSSASFVKYKIKVLNKHQLPNLGRVKIIDIEARPKLPVWCMLRFIDIFSILAPEKAHLVDKEVLPEETNKYGRRDLSSDQLVLLREFDTRGVDSIKSDTLRKLPFVLNNKNLKKMLDENPVLTPDIVLKYSAVDFADHPATIVQHNTENLRSKIKTGIIKFEMNTQVIWEKQNYAFVLALPVEDVQAHLFDPKANWGDEETDDPSVSRDTGKFSKKMFKTYVNNTNHPTLGKVTTLTIGWVRFTRISQRDIWIDEVQTDLSDAGIVPPSIVRGLGGMNGIVKMVMETFLSTMRGHGAQKFYMPNLRMKKEMYEADPPESIYTELPKKFRFKKTPFLETPLAKDNVWLSFVDSLDPNDYIQSVEVTESVCGDKKSSITEIKTKNENIPEIYVQQIGSKIELHPDLAQPPTKILGLTSIMLVSKVESMLVDGVLDDKTIRLMAIAVGYLVLPAWERRFPEDNIPRVCLETSKRYALGEADEEELKKAREAVGVTINNVINIDDGKPSDAVYALRAIEAAAMMNLKKALRDAVNFAEWAEEGDLVSTMQKVIDENVKTATYSAPVSMANPAVRAYMVQDVAPSVARNMNPEDDPRANMDADSAVELQMADDNVWVLAHHDDLAAHIRRLSGLIT